MSLSLHPLYVYALPSRKQNRESRVKNACNSNSHSNIAASNDKRPLFVQILAIPSASLVSTSLPIQCLQPSNFFFFRGIFAENFLPNLLEYVREVVGIRSEPIRIRWGGGRNTFRTYWNTLGRWLEYVREVVGIGSERIPTTSERIRGAFSSRSFPPPLRPIRHRKHMTPIHTNEYPTI